MVGKGLVEDDLFDAHLIERIGAPLVQFEL